MQITKENLAADRDAVIAQIAKLQGTLAYIEQLIAFEAKPAEEAIVENEPVAESE